MHALIVMLLKPVSSQALAYALCGMRMNMGILSIGHGLPKIMGGPVQWKWLGSAMQNIGIHFWFVQWGFLAACVEFFGGILLVLGLGTRVVAALLACTMVIAFLMHRQKKDPFMVYSFSLSLVVVYATYTYVGGGPLSLDSYLLGIL